MCVHRDFPNSLHVQCKYLVAMATDFNAFHPLVPFTWLFLWVDPLVSVMETIRRAVIRHSGASSSLPEPGCFLYLLDPRLTKVIGSGHH